MKTYTVKMRAGYRVGQTRVILLYHISYIYYRMPNLLQEIYELFIKQGMSKKGYIIMQMIFLKVFAFTQDFRAEKWRKFPYYKMGLKIFIIYNQNLHFYTILCQETKLSQFPLSDSCTILDNPEFFKKCILIRFKDFPIESLIDLFAIFLYYFNQLFVLYLSS